MYPPPVESSTKNSASVGELLGKEDSTKYRSIVGALQYLTLTCLDIAYSVNKVYQYLHALRMVAVKQIPHFLKYTSEYVFLILPSPSTMVSAFSDVDWVGCKNDRKSKGGLPYILDPISSHGVLRSKRRSLSQVPK
jgi:hypothetical protein